MTCVLKRMETIRGCSSAISAMLSAAALVGCPGPSGTDAGPGVDSVSITGEDASGGLPRTDLPVASTGADGTGRADFTCRGSRTAPRPGSRITTDFRLVVFGQDGQVARNTRVRIFPGNVITDTCAAPDCQEVTTNMEGIAAGVEVNANGWWAYRVFENRMGGTAATRYTDSVQYNKVAPAMSGSTVEGSAVAFSTLDLIPLSLGLEREPGTTIVAGRVQDCAETDVGGAVVRIFRPDGTEILDAGEATSIGPHYRYFRRIGDRSNPSNEQPYTNYEGLYATVNIPVSADLIRVETWGRREGDTAPVLLGCEGVRTLPNGVTIINIQPLRSDYEPGHPCARYL